MTTKSSFSSWALAAIALLCAVASIALLLKGGHAANIGAGLGGLSSACLLGLAWKGSVEAKTMTALSLVAGALAVYSAELFLTWHGSRESPIEYAKDHDRRTVREVVMDIRARSDPRAVPIIYPSYLITRSDLFANYELQVDGTAVLPLSGISARQTVLCNEGGAWARYVSDQFGFRNPPGVWKSQPQIGVVGDSFSHGNCVNDGEDWVARVRAAYPGTINLGMGGNGAMFELAALKEYLMPLQPPVVIWEFLEANEMRIPAEMEIPILKRYLGEPGFRQGLMERQAAIDKLLEGIVDRALSKPDLTPQAPGFPILNTFKLSRLRQTLGIRGNARNPNLALLREALRAGKQATGSWGGRLYFLYLPTALGITSDRPPSWYATREQVLEIAREEGLDVIDAYPEFRAHPDPLALFPYRGNFHYNAEGYRLVAEAVMRRLTTDGVLPVGKDSK